MSKWWENSTTSTYSLTAEDLGKAIKRLSSKEYFQECFERDKMRIASQVLVNKVWVAKEISDDEAFRYFQSININGFLCLHPKDKNLKVFQAYAEQMENTKPKDTE